MCDTQLPPISAFRSKEYLSPEGQFPNPLQCYDHPRPDRCRIPMAMCKPPLPRCPLGIYVERVKPFRPDQHYEPPSQPFDGLSHYREQYQLKCPDRVKSFKPKITFDPSDSKMDGLSSYRAAYTPKPSVPYQKPPWAKKAEFEPSGSKMEGISSYRAAYQGCMGEKVKSLKPNQGSFDPSGAKMEGCTTYRTAYSPYCSLEYKFAKQPQTMKDVAPAFSCAPMDGLSTYRAEFLPKCYVKRDSMKPTSQARFSDARFSGCTTYRNDFNPFHFERCVGPCIPIEVCDQACGDKGSYSDPCCPGPRKGSCGNGDY